MSLKERINEDMKSAMKAAGGGADPDARIKLDTIRLLNSEIKNAEIQKKAELAEDEMVEIIQRQLKRRREAIELYKKGGREDLVAKEEKESVVLASYLPEQLSDDDLRKFIQDAIIETGAKTPKEMGKLMSVLMPKVKGKADGRRVNEIALEFLKG